MFQLPHALTLIACISPVLSLAAQEKATSVKTVRLLTVGNSFSHDATRFLDSLTKASGHTLVHYPIIVGGASLALHWGRADFHEKDAADPKGLYGNKALKDVLSSGPWDYVTIQQASFLSHNLETYRPYAKQLHAYIKQHAPKAEILLHQTWAYRVDDPRFKPNVKGGPKSSEPATQKAMYDGLTKAYETVAAELGVRLIPVGDAFFLADSDPAWCYKPASSFDRKNAKPPTLPDQTHSLHVGLRWHKGKDGSTTLGMDGHHASALGQYLGACVFYEVLFGESVVGNSFVPAEMDAATAKYLQAAAHKAVQNRKSAK